ncbi:hypothetical protein [Desulfitibacter alkalitolerans]|uniref:hypothetical protein n=1 Tax=Desulfitibacter alkalitolerans TaxID=264641 RepID=UPI00048938A2|nr:hypothetical protein [Desulfitibacter alkalitolerans]
MKSTCKILISLLVLLTVVFVSSVGATNNDNFSVWDTSSFLAAFENKEDNLKNLEEEYKINSQIAEKQKLEYQFKELTNLTEQAKKLDNEFVIQSTSGTWWRLHGNSHGHGGSGIGYSESQWDNMNTLRIGSRAELGGNFWANGTGWVWFTPSQSGMYDLNVLYTLKGRNIAGDFATYLEVYNSDTGTLHQQTLLRNSNSYFDYEQYNQSKTFYLQANNSYALRFKGEANASTLGGVAMSDFTSREFDGQRRHIYVERISINKLY